MKDYSGWDRAWVRERPYEALDLIAELEEEIKRLKTRGGIAMSIMTVKQAERFRNRCEELEDAQRASKG